MIGVPVSMNHFLCRAATVLVLFSGFPLTAQEEPVPAAHPWLKWKTGTYFRSEMTIEAAGDSAPFGPIRFKYALAQRTDETYTLSVEMTGQGPKRESTVRRSLPRKAGTETLTLGEKKVEAVIWEETGELDGAAVTSRYWFAEGIPVPVKFSDTIEKQFQWTITATGARRKIEAAGATFDGWELKGTQKTLAEGFEKEYPLTAWFSGEMPGGLVLSKVAPPGEPKASIRVTEVSREK